MDVTLVLVDNGDVEPEIWGFRFPAQAVDFAAARSASAYTQTISVLDEADGAAAIAKEKESSS